MALTFSSFDPGVSQPRRAALAALIAERDAGLAQAVAALMRARGWRPRVLTPSERNAGLSRPLIARVRPDVVLVDPIALPEPAADWLARLATALPDLPVVVVTRTSTPEQRIRALRLGVDHWLTKPVAPEEIFATLETVTRATTPGGAYEEAEAVQAGELCIDPAALTCTVDGVILGLTVKEFGVLAYLAARRGRIVLRGEVFARVWGWKMLDRDRTIDVYVRRVRVKLREASPEWVYIHTHKRRGYRFDAVPVKTAVDGPPHTWDVS